jgi:hypothetical protein
MPGFNDTLNNVIAVVVVILILSLVVQSAQSVVKKFFKIKSRQIEESLVDLFANMLNKPGFQPTNWLDKLIDHSPMWRVVFFWRPSAAQQAEVENIYQHVIDGFKDVGRLAQSGKHMLDSISKGDLLKILEKVPIGSVLPSFVGGVESAFADIARLETAIKDIKNAAESGAAKDNFQSIIDNYQSMELLLGPVFSDVQSIIAADSVTIAETPASSPLEEPPRSARLLVRDVMILAEIDVDKLQALLDDMQKAVADARQSVGKGNPTALALSDLEAGLHHIAATIVALRFRLGPAVAAFNAKTKEASEWYDIVMQSFEERYNRSMKSWAVVIAFLVVAVLNANFFNIYRNIATSEVTRNLLVDKGSDVLKLSRERTVAGATPTNQPATQTATQPSTRTATQPSTQTATQPQTQTATQPSTQTATQPQTRTATQPSTQTATQPGQPATQATPPETELSQEAKAAKEKAESEQLKDAKKEFDAAIQLLKSDSELYKGIGFTPLQWQQVKHWFSSLTPDRETEQPWGLWWQARKHDLTGLLGWIIMTILLSIGAPFWQDTLESLFGVKNLLRKKGEIKNVEEKSGTGQPKP